MDQHGDKINAEANRVLGLVERTCRDLNDIDTRDLNDNDTRDLNDIDTVENFP